MKRQRGWKIILRHHSDGEELRYQLFDDCITTRNLEKELSLARSLYFVENVELHEKQGIVYLDTTGRDRSALFPMSELR